MKKKGIIIFSVFVAILAVLTIAYAVLKHNETPNRVLYNVYSDIAIWGVVIWQIVVIVFGILLWIKVFKDVPRPALYIGRGMTLIICLCALIFLADKWLNLYLDDGDYVVMEKDDYILIKHIGYNDEGSYSIWSKDGVFYRKYGINIGYYADSVAEGVFYSYVNGFADNTGIDLSAFNEEEDDTSETKKREYELLNKFIEITEDTYPEKFQRGLYWQEKDCADNSIGTTQVPIIDENGTQDMSWFCENICDWLKECLEEVPYEDAPWLYKEISIAMPSVSGSFDPSPYISGKYDRDALYEALYDFVDGKLTSADYPVKNQSYGMLEFVDNGGDEYLQSIEPDCTYTTKDGIIYGMLPVDRAAGSNYYCLVAYKKAGDKPSEINENPFNGMGGEAKWIEFIDDTNLGFACLTYSGGDEGMLFRTEDGGKSFVQVNYPSAKVKLSDGTIYNPFVIPEKVWVEDGNLYLLASQSPWSGDYYNEELDKHPSGLYVSHDDGMSFEYVGEQ